MDRPMTGEASETAGLLRRAAQGDQAAWGVLLVRARARLRRMVALRLARRLQGRVDPSDIIQEACIDASARLADYARQPYLVTGNSSGAALLSFSHFPLCVLDINNGVVLFPNAYQYANPGGNVDLRAQVRDT